MPQDPTQYAVRFPGMPLATYREVAAHLRSLSGVTIDLEWNTAATFQYTDSQIGSMRLTLAEAVDLDRLRAILQHYGSWQQSDE
ncbi:MAG: hypothetical protein HC818_02660 [Synechococcaceae cyanobacterium RM1_1_27]|nr:hypothetical protein [Synechococcaceae cyanobacterium RM1_1_27]